MSIPSQTERGAAWLSNFDAEYEDTARLLLNSVRIASSDEVRSGLVDLLQRKVVHRPAALILSCTRGPTQRPAERQEVAAQRRARSPNRPPR